jgi:hypothetical protein
MTAEQEPRPGSAEPDVDERQVDRRAQLLPEEAAAGSASPHAQAEAILVESEERTEHPDPDADSRAGRRTSADTV